MVHLRNDDKRLSIDGENRIFHIKVTASNLRHTQFCIKYTFLKFVCQSQNKTSQLVFPFSKHSSFSHNVNFAKNMNAKVTSNIGDCFSKFHWLCFNCDFVMAFDQILTKLMANLGQIKNCRVSFVVEYIFMRFVAFKKRKKEAMTRN